MLRYNERQPERKTNHVPVDDGADWVVRSIAAQFGLSLAHARVVCEQAHLGASDDRAASSGGRTK